MLGRPHHGFRARRARHHNGWVRFLQRQSPWVDDTILKMLAFPAERSRSRPGCENHIMGLFEALTIVGWIDIIGQTLYPTATHKTRDQTAARDAVDHGQFFGETQRIIDHWQGISQHDDLGTSGDFRQYGPGNIDRRLHAEGRRVMLINHDAVKARLVCHLILVVVAVVQLTGQLGIIQTIGQGQT